MNKKVKNATSKVYNGIKFRSLTEVRVYRWLRDNGYKPYYEPDSFVLLDKFKPETPWFLEGIAQTTKKGDSKTVAQMTYTPDFRLDINNALILYIEVKGHPNDSYPLKRKLFLDWIEKHNKKYTKQIQFAEIHTIVGLNKLMQQFK